MQCAFSKLKAWKLWAAAGLSAGLLELPFPLAGPLPVWRTAFAWFGLVPLLWALLSPACVEEPRPLRRALFRWPISAASSGTSATATGSATRCCATATCRRWRRRCCWLDSACVLGLYFGLFGLSVALVRRATGSTRLALAVAPVLWTALELAAARITSVPWDQLGYSQVDNALREPACALDRRLRHQLCAGGRERAAGGRFAAGSLLGKPIADRRLAGPLPVWFCWLAVGGIFVAPPQACGHGHRRADPAQSRRGRRQPLVRARRVGPPYRRIQRGLAEAS